MPKINWAKAAFAMAGIVMSIGLLVWQTWITKHASWIMWPLIVTTCFCFLMAAREIEWFRIFWASIVPPPRQAVLKQIESPGVSSERALREKVLQLGRDLFAFAREKEPEPQGPTAESGASLDDRFKWLSLGEKQRHEGSIIHGYELKFKRRVRDMYNELGERRIKHDGIGELGAIRQINNIKQIEKIARACFNIAKEMDIAEEKKKN